MPKVFKETNFQNRSRLNIKEYLFNKFNIDTEQIIVPKNETSQNTGDRFKKISITWKNEVYDYIDKSVYNRRGKYIGVSFVSNSNNDIFIIENVGDNDYYVFHKINCNIKKAREIISHFRIIQSKKTNIYRVSKVNYVAKAVKSYTIFEYELLLKIYSKNIYNEKYVTPSSGIKGLLSEDLQDKIEQCNYLYVDSLGAIKSFKRYRNSFKIKEIERKIERVKKRREVFDRKIRVYKQMIKNIKNSV
jgi:hypothetical protein